MGYVGQLLVAFAPFLYKASFFLTQGIVTAHLHVLTPKSWEKLGNNDIHDCVTRLLVMSNDA